MNMTKDTVINLLKRLINDIETADSADQDSLNSGLLILNDFALLNLVRNEIVRLRSDYSHLTELKKEFTNDIKKIGTELVRNAENRAQEVKRNMDSYEERICKQLETDIYRTFRRHFNTNLKELLLSQPEKILQGEFDDVIARVIRSTTGDAVVSEMHKSIERLSEENEELKKMLDGLTQSYNNLKSSCDDLSECIKEFREMKCKESGEDAPSDDVDDNKEKTAGSHEHKGKQGRKRDSDFHSSENEKKHAGSRKSDNGGDADGEKKEQTASSDAGSGKDPAGNAVDSTDNSVNEEVPQEVEGNSESGDEFSSEGTESEVVSAVKEKIKEKLSLRRAPGGGVPKKSGGRLKKRVVKSRGRR